MTAFLKLDDDHVYIANDPSRGPWSPDHCHAGPVAGAIARSVEIVAGGDKRLSRLTMDLLRPIPVAGFRVEVEMTREGRMTASAHAVLSDLSGKACVTANALFIAESDVGEMPTAEVRPLSPDDARPGTFPIQETLHDLPAFGRFIEVRYPDGEDDAPGPTKMWMKNVPLVEGETPSSFQRICPLADCGNAVSRNAPLREIGFVNPDLTIALHRQTSAEWFLTDTISHWGSNGIGLAEARISDADGPVAYALQSVILTPAR